MFLNTGLGYLVLFVSAFFPYYLILTLHSICIGSHAEGTMNEVVVLSHGVSVSSPSYEDLASLRSAVRSHRSCYMLD